MIEQIDALEKIKKLKDNSQDIIFADPPYALGSTVFIDTDGKPKYKEARDFMNKWDMPDHKFWEEFFIEANRVLKYGGRILFFGIDRQLMLFQYYAIASGLETKQSLYWYFISNFPKATDLSKNIDKRLKIEREIIGTKQFSERSIDGVMNKESCGLNQTKVNITKSNSELGKKYEGFKYSLSPLKQVLETIMVFQKKTKNNSILDDVFAYENGDNEISPSIWSIDNCRVPISLNNKDYKNNFSTVRKNPKSYNINSKDTYDLGIKTNNSTPNDKGRFPSQLMIDEKCSEKIDTQSGILTGDTSRILHKIGYLDEELDLLIYSPKVSGKERNAGLDDSFKEYADTIFGDGRQIQSIGYSSLKGTNKKKLPVKNNHPTLKPIKLIYNIAALLKTPNPQNVFFPFSGSGSEIIGFMKAGYDKDLFECSELSEDYIKIAKARIKYWEDIDMDTFIKEKELKKSVKDIDIW